MSGNVLIRVDHVRKKFCRSLRKSLQYGIQDIFADLRGQRHQEASLRRGEFYAVDDVSFELGRGECLGIIGRNGAGKTTLLKMLNGLIKPDAGEIRVRGRLGALIALGAGFNPLLSGRENIYVNGSVLGMSKIEIARKMESIIEFAEICEFIDSPVQSYSSGMVVRLGFAVAVHCNPESILLDEVLAVGDAAFQAKCFNTLNEFRNRGIGFILVSHNLSAIDCFCDRVLYLKRGHAAYIGDTRAGVAGFNRDMLNETESLSGTEGDLERVCGSGRVAIRRVQFLCETGEPIFEMQTGEPITLRLEYECATGEVVPTVVDVHIKDQAGVFFHDPRAVECEGLEGRGSIEIRIEAMPANNQRLFFSIALSGLDTWELFDWKCDIPLTVHGIARSQGRVQLSYSWSLVQAGKELAGAAGT